MAAYAAGDTAAARELVTSFGPLALRLAVRMLGAGAEAEDVAQEAMLRLWKVAADWRAGEARISTWLYRVTSNLCTDRLRQRKRQADSWPEGFDPPDEGRAPPDARLQDASRSSALQAALAILPERQRTAVVLRHLEDRSPPEVAAAMDVSLEAVESLLARGKRGLKAALDGTAAELGYKDE